jgi:pyridinium-3,5-biscarboxylic acid mononucleotide sulfurtransferase
MQRIEPGDKLSCLKDILRKYGNLMIAFSGGVDSAFLLAVGREVLGDHVVAVTGVSPIHPQRETRHATDLAQKLGVRHVKIRGKEMEMDEFVRNSKDRCYVCKRNLLLEMRKIADEMNILHIAHGANRDDLMDFRPGLSAAEELGVISPLIEAGLTKDDIRRLSKSMGLETWNKPSAPCLATRLPYGVSITEPVLKQIEQAENILIDHGVRLCRVRHHGDTARIETDEAGFDLLVKSGKRQDIIRKIRETGYVHVCLDLEGYAQGSMNRSI